MPMAACGADPIERESHCHCIFRTEEYSGILAQAPLFALQKSWPRRWLLGILRRRSHLPKERRRWLLGAPTVARCSSPPPPLDSRPSAAWSQLSARSDPVFVPTAPGEPWDLPRTFTRGVPYPTLTLMFVGAAAAGGGAGPNRCCLLAS